ncbi:MAG: hypothetical protein LC808_34330 [Actinobacteria bacterium]|nr:hypothetical protein [Actinomycetota bacterium]
MSILVRFSPAGLTDQQYQQVTHQLQESGAWPPAGLQLHVCFGNEGELRVSEVWESEEQMRAFGEKLMPVVEQAGVQMSAPPEVLPVVSMQTV